MQQNSKSKYQLKNTSALFGHAISGRTITDLNPPWHTINSLLWGESWLCTESTNLSLSLVNGKPKNKPEKLLCTVLFIIVPAENYSKGMNKQEHKSAMKTTKEEVLPKSLSWFWINRGTW